MTIADRVDLTNCDREPIHIPGAIQPHGFLVALGVRDLLIGRVSENVLSHCGVPAADAVGRTLDALIDPADVGRVTDALRAQADGAKPTYLFTVRCRGGGAYDAVGHRAGDDFIVECEPASGRGPPPPPELYRGTQSAIARMQAAPSLAEMYATCARAVRGLAGFDRVMVYRFDAEWNGSIIAEDKRDDLEPFLGLNYPASDIPTQARELYRRNTLRCIADRDYAASRLVPGDMPPLDMSLSVLRSVSPIHIEYLRNMGVGASMSVSLLKGGDLWGLVACHHYAPKFVPYDVRTACELLAQFMALQLTSRAASEAAAFGTRLAEAAEAFAARVAGEPGVEDALAGRVADLLELIPSGGAAVVADGAVHRAGQTPAPEDILDLSRWAGGRAGGEVFSTDALGRDAGNGALSPVAAGLLVVPLAPDGRTQLMWFRPERLRTVHWAGDPAKSVPKGEDGVRLSPRGSFALWKQTVRGRSEPWGAAELGAARHLMSRLAALLLARAAGLAREHRTLMLVDAERENQLERERAARESAERLNRMKDEFVATLSHELRTPLNAILGYAQLLRGGGAGPEDVAESIDIIERNARAQARMIDDLLDVSRITSGKLRLDVRPVELPAVVEEAIATTLPAARAKGIRVDRLLDPLEGVRVTGDPDRLRQVFWNLLSNAVKFTPKGGRVQVVLERVGSHVEASVSDTGRGIRPEFLPHVFERFRQEDASSTRVHGGLGLGLAIVRHLVELHGGTVQADSEGEGRGATFTVSLPVRAVRRGVQADDPAEHPTAPAGPPDYEALHLDGVRVLVVDDEPDARGLVRRVLEGCRAVVVTAGSAAEGLEQIGRGPFNVILSDIGMPGRDGFAFVADLRKFEADHGRPKTPVVALTAYARAEDRRRLMLAGFQVHMAKPVEPSELMAVVASLAGRV